jgi:hypothetical protein
MNVVLAVATILGGIAAIWFFWDKLIAFFGGQQGNAHDRELYEKYRALFLSNGIAEFYRRHDFMATFAESEWAPLSNYVDNWVGPEFEFVDKRLNKAHAAVKSAATRLGVSIAKNTVPIGNGHLRSVKPDYLPPGPTPDWIKREASEIQALVPAFMEAHDEFVKLAAKRLHT